MKRVGSPSTFSIVARDLSTGNLEDCTIWPSVVEYMFKDANINERW